MERKSILSMLAKMDPRLFIGLLFLYQLILIFQGFDIADEGFYATFYQQIFNDPESVQYNFMFWLSGMIGGAFNRIFPGLGLWGIRLEGVLIITATIAVTYQLLKKYLHPGHLKLGLFLVVLLLNNNRKTIYYDNLSILFYVIIALFLFTGLRDNKSRNLLLAGAFAGLNIFVRPPNLLGLGLGIVILYYGFLYKSSWKLQLRQVLFFAAGVVVSILALLGIMKAIGHFDLFVNSLKVLFSMGADENNRNYGTMNLIKNFYPPYLASLQTTLLVLMLLFVAFVLPGFVRYKAAIITVLQYLLQLGIAGLLLLMIFKDKDDNLLPLYLFTGLTIITGALILLSNTDKHIRTLMLIGCFIVVVYPFGSGAGLYTVGINVFWIAFPIAINFLFNIQSFDSNISLSGKQSASSVRVLITPQQFRLVRTTGIVLLVIACLLHAYFYPYFDRRNRATMLYSIDNKYLKGIFTSQDRAASFNELLTESAKHLKPGDYALAYDCMPMFHYVTETRPFIRNSWPYLYSKDVFKDELQKAKERTKILPVVVMQTTKTVGSGADWPTVPLKQDAEWTERNKGRNNYLQEFLTANNYKEVWTNGMFKIFVAGRDSL